MKKEELVALGLSEEDAQKVADASAKELNGFIPKSRLDEVIKERDTYKSEVTDRDKQLETLKKSSGDNEELKTQIADMQKANADAINAKDAEITKIKIDNAVEKALIESKAKNIKAVMALLDLENAELGEDGTVKGLADQIEKLKTKENTSFLFDAAQTQSTIKGATPPTGGTQTQGMTKKVEDMNFEEFQSYAEQHPEILND